MGLIEQKELTKEAAAEIIFSTAIETFEKMAETVECEYSPEEVKEAIMKQAGLWSILARKSGRIGQPLKKALRTTTYLPGDPAGRGLARALKNTEAPQSIINATLDIAKGIRHRPAGHVRDAQKWLKEQGLLKLLTQ